MEPNNCPKPDCGRPESTHRYSAGKKLSICGNGHSWDPVEVGAQKAKAREALAQEVRIKPSGHLRINLDMDQVRRDLEKRFRNPFD